MRITKKEAVLLLFLAFIVVFAIGCAEKQQDNPIAEVKPESESEASAAERIEDAIIGPSGCKSDGECMSYCQKNPFDCKAWCKVNKDVCDKKGISIDMPSGIPGSPCAKDDDCFTGLCLNFKCDIPSPDNIAKKSGFKLPGNCNTIAGCADYCGNPENSNECTKFCSNFPSFCALGKEASATGECNRCLSCSSKNCILDCTYKCYKYMNVKNPDIDSLKQGVVFERNYREPIKAVWEPGPAYNRIGMEYFIDDYKGMGINTYSITPKYNRENGKLVHTVDNSIRENADKEKIASIIRAKKAGLQVVLVAHDLYDMFPDANNNEKFNPGEYIDEIKATSLKWAKVAEDYKVEYFVPVNEFEYILYENGHTAEKSCEITNKIYNEIIPRVREIFKGKIYCRVGGMDAKFGCMDFSQCDIFGFTYGFTGGKRYGSNFDALFDAGEKLYEKYKKPYIMAEAFALLIRDASLEDCKRLHRAGMASYKEKAVHGIGYTFMGLIQRDPINKNDCTIEEANLVDDYTDFFKWMDENSK